MRRLAVWAALALFPWPLIYWVGQPYTSAVLWAEINGISVWPAFLLGAGVGLIGLMSLASSAE